MNGTDTIAAVATPPGNGGVSIVRISGPDAEKILLSVFAPAGKNALPLQSHLLTFGYVKENDRVLDECMAVIMRAPRSYTREDVAELQMHGGSFHVNKMLELCLKNGARLADPGEFTRRAFLNGRIDLSRAEAVMELISARGEQAHRAAVAQLEGGTAAFIRKAADDLYPDKSIVFNAENEQSINLSKRLFGDNIEDVAVLTAVSFGKVNDLV